MLKKREDSLKKSFDEVNEKLVIMSEDMRMFQKYYDEIIFDLVEVEIKKRFMIFSQRIFVVESFFFLNFEILEIDNDLDGSLDGRIDQGIFISIEVVGI